MLRVMESVAYKNTQALIVEDDAHNLMALSSLLSGLKIQFKRNTTGANVLQQAMRVRPDFILLDMDLPEGDSFAILEKLLANKDLQDTPVIAIGDSTLLDQLLPRIHNSGFAGHIAKPVSPRSFESLLASVLAASA